MQKVILIGCGNMGFAMLKGWLAEGAIDAQQIKVIEPNEHLRERIIKLNVHAYKSPLEIELSCKNTLIIIAVKPQILASVLKEYHEHAKAGATFLSVVAGIKISAIKALLNHNAPIMRVMPNTPAAIGKGMMVACANEHIDDEISTLIVKMMSANGAYTTVENEAQMDAVTALSGSGPAYIFAMIEAMASAGLAAGLPEKTAQLLAMQTVYGAASYAYSSSDAPSILRQQVTSPGGTTEAALKVLRADEGLEDLMKRTIKAAQKRSIALSET